MFVALVAGVVLPDMPHNSKGFSAEELQIAQLRLLEDTGESDNDAKDQPITYGLQVALRTPRLYGTCLLRVFWRSQLIYPALSQF